FRMRRRRRVRAAKRPCRQKRTVLLEKNAIIDQRVVQQQVRESMCLTTMLSYLHGFISNSFCRERSQPRGHSLPDKRSRSECVSDKHVAVTDRLSPYERVRQWRQPRRRCRSERPTMLQA